MDLKEYIASIAALVPSISASASATTSFGRSVDPETNTYTTVANLDNSYSLSGQIPVFAGLSGINTVRAARVMRLMGIEELQQARDEAALNAMQAYFDVCTTPKASGWHANSGRRAPPICTRAANSTNWG